MHDGFEPSGPYPEWPDDGLTRPLAGAGLPAGPGSQAGAGRTGRRPSGGSGEPDGGRDVALRRLSRLTWRATQLSAITAAAFAVLFARSAPAQTASTAPATTRPATPAASTAPATTAAPTSAHSATHRAAAPAASTPAAQPATAAAAPPSSAAPTLAPPTTPPAPAPAPSPVQSTSSGSHTGG